MNCLIIAGGSLEDAFALRCCRENNYEYTIAADAGLGFFYRNGLAPDLIVGDFDSADEEMLLRFKKELPDECSECVHSSADKRIKNVKPKQYPELIRLNPIKDDTDSEHAIREAIQRGASSITMLGATSGKRIDHLLGNIALLGIGLEAGVPITLLDSNNRIRMYRSNGTANRAFQVLKISRSEQYGKFLSLVPYQGRVTGVTLTGVKYPLTNYTMEAFSSLGISNEITEDEATISFQEGVLLVIESSDS